MISLSRLKEMAIEGGRRVAKVVQFGTKTADVISSFGDDSNPLPETIAIYANTSEVGDDIIIGYLNANQIAEIGEKRIFSLRDDGTLSFSIHLKNDGTCEIGGDTDFAVRYSELETAFNELKGKVNDLIQNYNTHSHAANGGAPPASPATPSSADITTAKIDEIKVP